MATKAQLDYFRSLLSKNQASAVEYDLSEQIPHSVISPVLNKMKLGEVPPPKIWNDMVAEYMNGAQTEKPVSESQDKPSGRYDFKEEIDQIKSIFMKDLVKKMLNKVPDYFWHVPASSTGKYHPEYALGEGGLLRHTKAAVKVAISLFEDNILHRFNQDEQDIVIAALILHDTVKHGLIKQNYTVVEHPILVEKLLDLSMLDGASETQAEMVRTMFKAIRSHMGPWNTDRSGKEIMPKPSSALERFVHLCDYLASRRFLEVNFNK